MSEKPKYESQVTPLDAVSDLRKSLTKAQVQLRTSKYFQRIVVVVVIFAVFVDILGTVVVAPALASLCAYAEGGIVDNIMIVSEEEAQYMGFPDQATFRAATMKETISPHAFKGEQGAWAGAPPVKFSLSMNLVLSAGQFGSAGGSMLFGRLCDTVGAKIPMMVCLIMGIIGYLIIYAAGIWVHSYYLFAIGMFWNNFFGNTAGVACTYFGQIFDGQERDMYVGLTVGMLMVGGGMGSFIVMPFANNPPNGENFFNAIWLCIGLTALAVMLVSFVMVAPKEKKEEEKVEATTPKLAKRMLIIMVIASALDSGGDEGTRMARGTILSNLFPKWSTTAMQNYLMLAMIGVAIVAGLLGVVLSKVGLTFPHVAVLGCAATLATQLILALIEFKDDTKYLAVWHCGKLFGFLSTFSNGPILNAFAPKELLGYWTGINEATTNLMTAIAPLVFATVYDEVGNPYGKEMLLCTSGISLLAMLAYCPLIGKMPKAESEEAEKKKELESLEYYEKLSDLEWSKLPLEVTDKVMEKFFEEQKMPRLACWGQYAEERPHLSDIHERAAVDFKYLSKQMVALLTNRERMKKEQEMYKAYHEMMPTPNRDAAKLEMGSWIADYLDDAGYVNWETQTQVYKAMFLTAFPPIDALEGEKPDYGTISIEKWEDVLSKFMFVMDMHLAASQLQIKTKTSLGSAMNLLKRR